MTAVTQEGRGTVFSPKYPLHHLTNCLYAVYLYVSSLGLSKTPYTEKIVFLVAMVLLSIPKEFQINIK